MMQAFGCLLFGFELFPAFELFEQQGFDGFDPRVDSVDFVRGVSVQAAVTELFDQFGLFLLKLSDFVG